MLATFIDPVPKPTESVNDPIECTVLDSQHRLWIRAYLDNCRYMLREEQNSPRADLLMVTYLRGQIHRYEALLRQFS